MRSWIGKVTTTALLSTAAVEDSPSSTNSTTPVRKRLSSSSISLATISLPDTTTEFVQPFLPPIPTAWHERALTFRFGSTDNDNFDIDIEISNGGDSEDSDDDGDDDGGSDSSGESAGCLNRRENLAKLPVTLTGSSAIDSSSVSENAAKSSLYPSTQRPTSSPAPTKALSSRPSLETSTWSPPTSSSTKTTGRLITQPSSTALSTKAFSSSIDKLDALYEERAESSAFLDGEHHGYYEGYIDGEHHRPYVFTKVSLVPSESIPTITPTAESKTMNSEPVETSLPGVTIVGPGHLSHPNPVTVYPISTPDRLESAHSIYEPGASTPTPLTASTRVPPVWHPYNPYEPYGYAPYETAYNGGSASLEPAQGPAQGPAPSLVYPQHPQEMHTPSPPPASYNYYPYAGYRSFVVPSVLASARPQETQGPQKPLSNSPGSSYTPENGAEPYYYAGPLPVMPTGYAADMPHENLRKRDDDGPSRRQFRSRRRSRRGQKSKQDLAQPVKLDASYGGTPSPGSGNYYMSYANSNNYGSNYGTGSSGYGSYQPPAVGSYTNSGYTGPRFFDFLSQLCPCNWFGRNYNNAQNPVGGYYGSYYPAPQPAPAYVPAPAPQPQQQYYYVQSLQPQYYLQPASPSYYYYPAATTAPATDAGTNAGGYSPSNAQPGSSPQDEDPQDPPSQDQPTQAPQIPQGQQAQPAPQAQPAQPAPAAPQAPQAQPAQPQNQYPPTQNGPSAQNQPSQGQYPANPANGAPQNPQSEGYQQPPPSNPQQNSGTGGAPQYGVNSGDNSNGMLAVEDSPVEAAYEQSPTVAVPAQLKLQEAVAVSTTAAAPTKIAAASIQSVSPASASARVVQPNKVSESAVADESSVNTGGPLQRPDVMFAPSVQPVPKLQLAQPANKQESLRQPQAQSPLADQRQQAPLAPVYESSKSSPQAEEQLRAIIMMQRQREQQWNEQMQATQRQIAQMQAAQMQAAQVQAAQVQAAQLQAQQYAAQLYAAQARAQQAQQAAAAQSSYLLQAASSANVTPQTVLETMTGAEVNARPSLSLEDRLKPAINVFKD